MSQQMRNGYGFDFPVPVGQSMLVSSITGTYTATIVAGPGKGTALATDSTGGGTYGPYSGGVVIRLQAGANSLIDYDIAVSPVLTYAGPLNAGYNSSGDVASAVDGAGNSYPLARGVPILAGASAGADSGWLPINAAPERFAYQLDSGSTTTTFSIDISADGVTSLGQAFTGTWESSSSAEITPQIMFSNPLAKFFRWNVVSGGPLSVNRGM